MVTGGKVGWGGDVEWGVAGGVGEGEQDEGRYRGERQLVLGCVAWLQEGLWGTLVEDGLGTLLPVWNCGVLMQYCPGARWRSVHAKQEVRWSGGL